MIKNIIHVSDIHLDHLDSDLEIIQFAKFLNDSPGDVVVCTGDNSNAKLCFSNLDLLQTELKKPFYFVHGNHDYYCGNIKEHRQKTKERYNKEPFLFLTEYGKPIYLKQDVVLIGDDGWYDGRAGEWAQIIMMADFHYIEELARHNWKGYMIGNKVGLWSEIQSIARESIDRISSKIENILTEHKEVKKIILSTHVPPWWEASLHNGRPSSPAWAPGFVNYLLGRYLELTARNNPDVEFLVLCGHSHHQATVRIEPNLVCETAFAEYKHPHWS